MSTFEGSPSSYDFIDESHTAGQVTASSSRPSVQRAGGPWVAYDERKVPVLRAIDVQSLTAIAAVGAQVLEKDSWFERDLHLFQGFEWEGEKGMELNTVVGLTKRCVKAEKMSTELGFVTAMGKIQLAAKVRRSHSHLC